MRLSVSNPGAIGMACLEGSGWCVWIGVRRRSRKYWSLGAVAYPHADWKLTAFGPLALLVRYPR